MYQSPYPRDNDDAPRLGILSRPPIPRPIA